MAEPEVTRVTIRRAIGRMLRGEFFLRYGKNGFITHSSGTASTEYLMDTDELFQDADMWRGDWAYVATTDEERIISGYDAGNHRLLLEWPLTNLPDTTDQIEIWGNWPPSLVNSAINQAIRGTWRFFPNVVTNEQMVIQEDRMRYGILASDFVQDTLDDFPSVGKLLQMWIERSANVIRGQVTIGSSLDAFTDSDMNDDTTPDTDWLVSIYDGPGVGQLREVTSVDSVGLVTPSTAFETAPTTDSKYALWHPEVGEQIDDWYRLTAVRFDQPENPSEFYLTRTYNSAAGLRFRLTYVSQSTDLAADSDVAFAPENYLVYKAIHHLYAGTVGDNRADRQANASLAEYYDQLARSYAQEETRELPAGTLWSERDFGGYSDYSVTDPLDWNN